jgi:hypothetical protein
MSQSLLVRHPPPHLTESLFGYVVRLTEANGYASPRDLYRLAGMNGNEISASNFCCSKFAAIANHPASCLERIAFKSSQSESSTRCLLGNRVGANDLNLTGARACPDCVVEKGFIEAHWHIDLMVACPIHERAAVWYCPKCKNRLSWMRSGLLTCRCGAPFQPPSDSVFFQPELRLLEIIRRKALGDRTLHKDACMPERQFATMSLQSGLSLIRFLGNQRLMASRSKGPKTARPILQAAAKVLTEWPTNFHKLLHDLCPIRSTNIETPPIENFADIYEVISKRTADRYQAQRLATQVPTPVAAGPRLAI